MYALLNAALHHTSVCGSDIATLMRDRAWDIANAKFTLDGRPQYPRGRENDFVDLFHSCAQELAELAPNHNFANKLLLVEYNLACTLCTTHAGGGSAPCFRHLALYRPHSYNYADPLEVCLH